jgi:CheY-like chemotaxis protein
VAYDGRETLERLDRDAFDILLLDCQMPKMDGFEVARRIRSAEHGARIPIVAMTANAMKGDRERCLEAGMDDYISKPIDRQRMEEVLERWTGKRSKNELLETQIHEQLPPWMVSTDEELLGALKASLGVVPQQVLVERARAFLTATSPALRQLAQACSGEDLEGIGHAAGELRARCKELGAAEVEHAFEQIQVHALDKDPRGAETVLKCLQRQFERLELAAKG